MYIENGDQALGDTGRKPWACTGADESKLVDHREKVRDFNQLLDNYDVSIAMYNGSTTYRRNKAVGQQRNGVTQYREEPGDVTLHGAWNRNVTKKFLDDRHNSLKSIAASFASIGYEYLEIEAEMLSPLVIGLGNEHPSEKGFHFDWTLGIPAIPAAGIKGVVRLAWLVDRLNEKPETEARRFWNEITGRWLRDDGKGESILPEEARNIFGCGEITRPEERKQANARGKVIFLDALPATLPRLAAEIMNCHYPDYLNKPANDPGFRGPTEDQNPNPQKFWAVAHLDKHGKPLRFVFRLLIHNEIAADADRKKTLLAAVDNALAQHGMGAKTAIGHGRFHAMNPPGTGKGGSGKDTIDRPATPAPNPEQVRQDKLAAFRNALPKLQELPSRMQAEIAKVRNEQEIELRREMCRALLDLARSDKKRFKEAKRNNKKWAIVILELSGELGIDIS